MSVSKKKAPNKAERSKGIELLSNAALLEEAQLKKAIKRRKWETNIHQVGGSNEEEEDEFVHTPDNHVPTDDENVDDEEFEQINKEMYSDVNVELKDSERESEAKDDKEIIDAGQVDAELENVSQEVVRDQDKDDPHATVMAALAIQKTVVQL
ncbi:hypothetical protein Tco_1171286 [Tanacetum coccineum]